MRSDNRRETRHRCSINVELHSDGKTSDAQVFDISETGMCVMIGHGVTIRTGEDVEVFSEELGWLSGKARWRLPDRLGIEFRLSSNTRAKLKAFQKYFMEARLTT
jgi:hypothetical protein